MNVNLSATRKMLVMAIRGTIDAVATTARVNGLACTALTTGYRRLAQSVELGISLVKLKTCDVMSVEHRGRTQKWA